MNGTGNYLGHLLRNLRTLREKMGLSLDELENRLILGPGWITCFEKGEIVPSVNMLLAILHEMGATLDDLLVGLPEHADIPQVEQRIFAEQADSDIVIHFRYANFDATYTLENANVRSV